MKILEVLYHNNKPYTCVVEGFYCGLALRAGVGRGHGRGRGGCSGGGLDMARRTTAI